MSRLVSERLRRKCHGYRSYFGTPPIVDQRRVVVTGLGLVTPLGPNVDSTWQRLVQGDCAIATIQQCDVKGWPSTIAAEVKRGLGLNEFNADQWLDPKNKRAQSVDFIAFAMASASQALQDAKWNPESEHEATRSGIAFGAGVGNIEEIFENGLLVNAGIRKVSPFFVPRILINLAAGHISIRHNLKGPNHSCVTACATGAHSIGDAYRFIKYGDADVMVAGGSEASINPLSLAGFIRVKALTTKYNDDPLGSSRPFDADRDGFVMGEGSGAMVLEEMKHAIARGAKIYAEVRGYGLSGDAHHITAPHASGNGPFRAMQAAMAQSGLKLSDIDYINAHATSTSLGDFAENKAIKDLFGSHAYNLAISSTKGAIGHLLGAAGAVESIFAVKSIQENIAPPTLNLHTTTPDFDLNYVPLEAQSKPIQAALSNSFGFGGTNASLLFTKFQE